MKAAVCVTIKQNVLDPQGKAVQNALQSLGFAEVSQVRIGKYIELELDTSDVAAAEVRVKEICEKLLANPVVEDYRIEIIP